MKYVLTGECKHCGECCKQLMKARLMVSKKTGVCRFLKEEPNGTYSCFITKSQTDLKSPKKPKGVTVRQFEYWMRECLPYPDPEDPSHLPPRFEMPSYCGYKMIPVE